MKMKRKHLANVLCIAVLLTAGISCSNHKEKTEAERKEDDLWYKKKIERSIANGEDLNAPLPGNPGDTHLHEAAKGNYIESAKLLLSRGVDVNVRNDANDTPLHRAVFNGHVEIARLLLENGADVDAKDIGGNPPLSPAVRASANMEEIVLLLLEFGANMTIKSDSQRTLLFDAAYSDNIFAIRLFLAKGVDINAADNLGDTALHIAALYGRSKAVKVLLENGANVNAISNYETPLDCALKPMEWKYASPWGKRKSVSLIKKYGGKKAVELKKP